jgi:hypothetical protein
MHLESEQGIVVLRGLESHEVFFPDVRALDLDECNCAKIPNLSTEKFALTAIRELYESCK